MVESRYTDSEGYHSTTRYTYYDIENKENLDIVTDRMGGLPELEFAGLLGIQSKNLVHTETSDYDAAYKDNYEWEYDLNADGYVTEAIALRPDETGTAYTRSINHLNTNLKKEKMFRNIFSFFIQ